MYRPGEPRLAALLDAETLFAPQPRVELDAATSESYPRVVSELLAGSRLHRGFPPKKPLRALFSLLSPSACHHLYGGVEIGVRTGLPTERTVSRLVADASVASEVVAEAEARRPALASSPVEPSSPTDDPYLRRYRYHRRLLASRLPPTFALETRLRRLEDGGRSAHLTVVLDRFDLSEELFVRYAAEIVYSGGAWRRDQVRIDDHQVTVSRNFENLVARATAHDSELAFILLSEIDSLEVRSVTRSRIGPLHGAGFDGARAVQELVEAHPGELVLSLPADRTAVDIPRDHYGDPLAVAYREFLSGACRGMVEVKRQQLGYRVDQRRKFVCTPRIAEPLGRLLRDLERPCVIHTVR